MKMKNEIIIMKMKIMKWKYENNNNEIIIMK